ncbi:hypothetical protein HJC99_02590 [Candidatus Saccharibacteria bacterium]|nr:hypothetical protein [Candidatus Saccharibacteria bacterium]
MSAEQGPINHESAERQSELDKLAEAQLAEQEASAEAAAENHRDDQGERAETARKVIDQQEQSKEEPVAAAENQAPKPTFMGRLNPHLSYTETMASMQHKLSPASRSFSKVIHAPLVEKTSEALESSVMRPSVTLGAVVTALIVAGTFYYFARTYGYAMRGSELVVSLVAGGIIGVVLEGLVRSLHPRHK